MNDARRAELRRAAGSRRSSSGAKRIRASSTSPSPAGFVSSQAFVDRYEADGPIPTLLPAKADDGLTFVPTHPKADEALDWMGFEARSAILDVLDQAIADTQAQVRVVAYDLNEPEIVSRLETARRPRLKMIIDDSRRPRPGRLGRDAGGSSGSQASAGAET